jgi:hypothetical protein
MKCMQIKRRVIINSILITLIIPIYGIQKNTVYLGTSLTAIIGGLGSYKTWSFLKNDIHPAVFGIITTALTSSVYFYLYKFTPEGRLRKADILLDELMHYKLAKFPFNNDKEFFNTVHDVYLTHDLPLISAYNHLIYLVPMVQRVFWLIHKSSIEIPKRNYILRNNYIITLKNIKKTFRNISEAIKRIRAHKDYLPQLQIYKEFLINDKQVMVQEQMAHAQIKMAHAQQSSTLLKWLKALFGSR